VLSSIYALPGKLLMGTSGIVVDHIGYPKFFLHRRFPACSSCLFRPVTTAAPRVMILFMGTSCGASRKSPMAPLGNYAGRGRMAAA
jgi:hypothetical protein